MAVNYDGRGLYREPYAEITQGVWYSSASWVVFNLFILPISLDSGDLGEMNRDEQ